MSTSCEQNRPIMKDICEIIGDKKPKIDSCNPGLWLDKFAMPGNQENQRKEINHVCSLNANVKKGEGALLLAEARSNREKTFGENVLKFIAQTTGPFTLHLARASALENAGICLHPVYGFAYIPGTALKGMAHAFACEVWLWLPMQDDKQTACRQICEIFGWTSSMPWVSKLKKKYPVQELSGESIGAVVFHDAWPLKWPELICDITNNHHSKYYGATERDLTDKPDDFAPGDWENPVPVYFLAVAPGEEFDFPLSLHPIAALSNPRSAFEHTDDMLKLVCQWVLCALEHRGVGAKTNTGYGRFQLKQSPDNYASFENEADEIWRKATDKNTGHFCEETFTLELVTPAFLAGSDQKAEDCDLRPATLRGQLRWWWRTMHSGHLDVFTLKKLEDAIWGSSEIGGAVSIEVMFESSGEATLFDKQAISKESHLEVPPNKKTAQGLSYLAFGMDETKKDQEQKDRTPRHYVEQLRWWKVTFTTRSVKKDKDEKKKLELSAKTVFEEVVNAFYLLCNFGGVGAKSRNGFGSLNDPDGLKSLTIGRCRDSAAKLRQSLNIDTGFDEKKMFSPSIDSSAILQNEIKTFWKNVWYTLDQLGFSYQEFAQSKKHQLEKKALGLPRRIGNPARGQFNLSDYAKEAGRYASPFFFHLDRNADETYSIRVTAFPTRFLPDIKTSRDMLKQLLDHLKNDLEKRVNDYKDKGQTPPVPPAKVTTEDGHCSVLLSSNCVLPKSGVQVEAILLEVKTKKGGWLAQHVATKIEGPIQNSDKVPSDKKQGDLLTLIVALANEREIAFRYPTEAEKQRTQKSKSHKKDQRFRGGRR